MSIMPGFQHHDLSNWPKGPLPRIPSSIAPTMESPVFRARNLLDGSLPEIGSSRADSCSMSPSSCPMTLRTW